MILDYIIILITVIMIIMREDKKSLPDVLFKTQVLEEVK